jgi:hypothetical protein
MRATEFIRGILDLIDGLEQASNPSVTGEIVATANDPADINHFRQIIDLVANKTKDTWENEPSEKVSDIAAVTTDDGGGINGPKNPHDIRVKDPSAYPNQQGV